MKRFCLLLTLQSHRPMPNPRLSVTRSVKRWHNTDTVLHGPMPSKPCLQSKCVQGRHAFTTPVRGLDTSSVTTNAAMQIVKVVQLQIIPTRLRSRTAYFSSDVFYA